jgi:hypothetical protein
MRRTCGGIKRDARAFGRMGNCPLSYTKRFVTLNQIGSNNIEWETGYA